MAGGIDAIATLLLAACALFNRSSPPKVEANKSAASCKYRNDDEPIQTNQQFFTVVAFDLPGS